MPKQAHRKPPKRKSQRRQIDPDLVELALAIDERRIVSRSAGWFLLPWRNGWNAAQAAYDAALITFSANSNSDTDREIAALFASREETAENYWRVGDWLLRPSYYPESSLSPSFCDAITEGVRAQFLRAALRCVQVMIAKSDGAGHVYNAILAQGFAGVLPDLYEEIIERARCADAIGPSNPTSEYARRKRAFEIAWRRGLFSAAYAV